MTERHSLEHISTKRSKIATLAGIEPKQVLTTLSHHIDYDWLCEAHRRTRKDGAVGVDGVDAKRYAKQLDENLLDLLGRFKSGAYRAPAVKRVHIDKGDGRSTRPLGIPSFEDKILQRAVVMVLEPIYWAVAGSLTWTSNSSLITWTGITCMECSTKEYATELFAAL